jgi:uncharacterized protein (TIGR03435 family)
MLHRNRIAATCVGISFGLIGQGPVTKAFDVASVRRLVGVPGGLTIETSPTGLTMDHVTLGSCIRWAYGRRALETWFTVGPDWIDPPHPEWYAITARTSEPVPTDQLRLMLRPLLAERFKLAFHRESRAMAAFALRTAPGTPKLARSDHSDGDGHISPTTINVFKCEGVPMGRLAEFLASMMHVPSEARPVVDETGVTGSFDFTLDVRRNFDSTLDERGHVNMEANVMRALPSLGLKLVATRAPVEVLIIDHVDRMPTAN